MIQSRTFFQATLTALLITLPVLSHAESSPFRGPIPFSAFDTDGNGMISEQEFKRTHDQRAAQREAEGRPMRRQPPAFKSFDSNGDQLISAEELAAGQRGRQLEPGSLGKYDNIGRGRNMPAFAEFDLNKDDWITEKELDEARAQRISERAGQGYLMRNIGQAPAFSVIDSNQDGKISEAEFTAHQASHMRQSASGSGRGRNMPSFGDFDVNNDGRISEKELDEGRAQRISDRAAKGFRMRGLSSAPTFKELDSDGNGSISKDEFATHQAQHRQQPR